ncbi:MAG TPA: zinc-dependent metalloprotease family protein [Phycisphaerae bacterium]|nr:zinc-dependent metalloprotease family protein [Phycisphaerae bacterium]
MKGSTVRPQPCRILTLSVIAALSTLVTGSMASAADFGAEPSHAAWTKLDAIPQARTAGEPWVRPEKFQAVTLDRQSMANVLRLAPPENNVGAPENSTLILTLPKPDGSFETFRVVDSPVMEPGLAAQFPDIKTWLGQGIDDPAASVRLDMTPLGFHAQVLSPNGRYYIDPYTRNDWDLYTSYYLRDLRDTHGFSCQMPDQGAKLFPNGLPEGGVINSSGGTRRTYRLANACTGEYAAFFGGTVALAQAAIVTAINRVTGVYEIECAIRLTLIANNTLIVYTNSATDPYTNNSPSSLLTQNQTTCDNVIGSANYDIGHVFSTGGGGLASLSVVCVNGSKARGETGSSSPVGDGYYIDYVAHEMGHQFGGTHNFNGQLGSCGGGNRTASTAYEPGSGNSIMAYAGICLGDDLQPHSDAYFQHISYDQIVAFVTSGSGAGCAATVATGNNPPTVNAGADYTIPKQTPFQLTATGSDPDGDTITYLWDERDLGAAQDAVGGIIADNGASPFIRAWPAVASNIRIVPRLSDLLANTLAFGEQLPNTNRTVNFRCTIRDNRAGSGGVNFDSMVITVTTASGPFQVTSPNTAVTWSGTQTVTWNVANTAAAPVSCANVRILLSTDGGNSFPTVLVASAPNNGSASVTLPNINNSSARIRVEAVGNIFFDISDTNFTISMVNDNCAGAKIIGVGSYTDNTRTATNDGTASCGQSTASPDMWYLFLAPCTGTLNLDTHGSAFDTALSVHSACPGTAANEIICNDDCVPGSDLQSCLSIPVISGNTYLIRVAGYQGASGFLTLNAFMQPPANDNCNAAPVIGNGTYSFTNCGATTDGPDEPASCTFFSYSQIDADVWFRYVAPCTGTVRASLCGSGYDTKMAVYNGVCPAAPGSVITCNDDTCSLQSYVVFVASAGNQYLLRIGGYAGHQGDGILNIYCCGILPDGDMNLDSLHDGLDIQQFANSVLANSIDPIDVCHGDFSNDGIVDLADIPGMVAKLLGP